jgi:hypothetical protein
MMKHFKLVLVALMVGGTVSLLSFTEPLRLIQIQKGGPELLGVLRGLQVDVIQELGSCYLARADRQDVRALKESGIPVTVLDRDVRGKSFLLIPSPSPPELSRLVRLGHLLEVEPGTFLFSREAGDPAAILPPGLPWKPLPTATILPYLRAGLPSRSAPPVAQPANDLVAEITGRISADNLRGLVQALQDFETRYVSTTGCAAAAQFIYNYYQALGLDVRFQDVQYSEDAVSRNVIAELPGRVYPEDVLIICGHYDSISDEATVLAPGADDNASGTAMVMEAARILTRFPLDFTVRFVAFTAEEIGLFGSRVYSAEARAHRENIIAVINLDMIAYPDELPEDLEIIVNPASEWLAAKFLGVCGTYGLVDANRVVDPSIIYSDHSPFWDQGYSALLAIEDYPVQNPYYHGISDTIDTLNSEFFSDSARAALAVLAEMAQPVRIGYPVAPEELLTASYTYSSLYNSFRNIRLSWASRPGAAGYNIYRSQTPHQDFTKLNPSPVAETAYLDRYLPTDSSFFYVVTTVGADGLESNRSRQVSAWPEVSVSAQTQADRFVIFRLGAQR